MRAHHRNVAPVIAGSILLFIATIVLFIDDGEAEILHRSEYSRSSADHYAGLFGLDGTSEPEGGIAEVTPIRREDRADSGA